MVRSSRHLSAIMAIGLCLVALSLMLPRLAESGFAAASPNETVPMLTVGKEDNTTSIHPGERITYTLTYTNVLSEMTFPDVELAEVVPANTRFVKDASTAGWDCDDASSAGTVCILTIGSVPPSTGGDARFVVEVLDPLEEVATVISNTVDVKSFGFVYESAETATPLETAIDLEFQKSDFLLVDADTNGIASPGDTLRYTVTTTLQGNSPVAGLVLTDNPDPSTFLLTGTVESSRGAVVMGNMDGDTAVQVDLGDLRPGEEAQVIFDVAIRNPLAPNVTRISNQAFLNSDNAPTISSDDPGTPNTAGDPTVTNLLARAELAASKTDELLVDADSSGDPSPGDTLRYRVIIDNNGNQSVADVVFADELDPNLELVSGSVTASQGLISADKSSVSVNIGTVPGDGGSVRIVFAAKINNSVPNGVSEVTNQGTVTSAVLADVVTDDPDFDGSFDPTRTSITADADVYLSLDDLLYGDTDGDQVVSSGDTLLYAARLFNNGNQSAINVLYEHILSAQLELAYDEEKSTGYVRTTAGRIEEGNNQGDESIRLSLDELEGGDSVLITYIVTVRDTTNSRSLATQSQATFFSNTEQQIVSNDPDGGGPTVTIIGDGTGGFLGVYLPLAATEE